MGVHGALSTLERVQKKNPFSLVEKSDSVWTEGKPKKKIEV